ncbi:MAG: hypothetical protein IKR85_00325 [Clostridia bacterium]|nr:hypothetical protein [Clostridia bacterium]
MKKQLEEVQYGNYGKVKYTYDDFDRVTGILTTMRQHRSIHTKKPLNAARQAV